MRAVDPGRVRSEINITPLVDVVLVLLIIFMVVAPQLSAGPSLILPATEDPAERADDSRRILVGIERGGGLWIDDQPIGPERFQARMQELAVERSDWDVAIRGDAALTFGEVRQAMRVVESAGFQRVGLIARMRSGE